LYRGYSDAFLFVIQEQRGQLINATQNKIVGAHDAGKKAETLMSKTMEATDSNILEAGVTSQIESGANLPNNLMH
jgi:hypothetical protein